MSQIQNNTPINNGLTGTPLYTYASEPSQQQTVNVSPSANSMVYAYPQTSIYNGTNKQPASGVNIYIYNPSAIGGPSTNSTSSTTLPAPATFKDIKHNDDPGAINAASSIASSPVSENREIINANGKKSFHVVELTDDYIKTLESYLKSPDKQVRQAGIKELIKRYEEDISRYNDPALTALLNIALLDPEASNRLLTMSVISSGSAQGDETTIELLKKAEQSDKLYGQEAILANKAILKAVEPRKPI